MKNPLIKFIRICVIPLLLASTAPANLLLNNPSFETETGYDDSGSYDGTIAAVRTESLLLSGWRIGFPAFGYGGLSSDELDQGVIDTPTNKDGNNSFRFNNAVIQTAIADRAIVVPGKPYVLSALHGNLSRIGGSAVVTFEIEWFSAAGVFLSASTSTFDSALRAEDAPLTPVFVSGIAPAGAVLAGVKVSFLSDWIYFDNFNLVEPVPASVTIGQYAGLMINGTVGANYVIETSLTLSPGEWTPLQALRLPTNPFLFFDTTPMSGKRFYRIVTP